MAEQGAALQTYNNELVKCLDELCEKRSILQKEIDKEEQEKFALETQHKNIQDKLTRTNTKLNDKYATKKEYDKLISESEQAYVKILESSQVLLNVVKRDAASLNHKSSTSEKTSGNTSTTGDRRVTMPGSNSNFNG